MPKYQPTEADLAFVQNVIDHIKDGGEWIWPADGTTYKLSPRRKQAVLTVGDPESQNHKRAVVVFSTLGWETKVALRTTH